MTVRKPSREFWLLKTACMKEWHAMSKEPEKSILKKYKMKVREILPGDDSIRVSREDWEKIKDFMYERGDCESQPFIERIERENPPKQD